MKQPTENNMILPILAEMTGSIQSDWRRSARPLVSPDRHGRRFGSRPNPGAATPILVQAILAIALAEAIVFYALFLAPK